MEATKSSMAAPVVHPATCATVSEVDYVVPYKTEGGPLGGCREQKGDKTKTGIKLLQKDFV